MDIPYSRGAIRAGDGQGAPVRAEGWPTPHGDVLHVALHCVTPRVLPKYPLWESGRGRGDPAPYPIRATVTSTAARTGDGPAPGARRGVLRRGGAGRVGTAAR